VPLADLLGRMAGCFPRRETRQSCRQMLSGLPLMRSVASPRTGTRGAAIVSGSAAALHNAGSPGAPRLVVAAVVSQAPAPRSAEEGGTDLETGMVTCLRANSHPQRKQGVHMSLSRIAGRW
jgi:hypothetical protein